MTTDGVIPPPCNEDIFRNGKPIAFLDGRSSAIETWVKRVSTVANAHIDWHYSGGVAQVLYLGDTTDKMRIIATIQELASTLQGTVLRVLTEDTPGLYREGVTEVPENTVASYYDGGDTSVYIVDEN